MVMLKWARGLQVESWNIMVTVPAMIAQAMDTATVVALVRRVARAVHHRLRHIMGTHLIQTLRITVQISRIIVPLVQTNHIIVHLVQTSRIIAHLVQTGPIIAHLVQTGPIMVHLRIGPIIPLSMMITALHLPRVPRLHLPYCSKR